MQEGSRGKKTVGIPADITEGVPGTIHDKSHKAFPEITSSGENLGRIPMKNLEPRRNHGKTQSGIHGETEECP